MANNHFITSCYGYRTSENNAVVPLGGAQGALQSLPSALTRFYPAAAGDAINGVTVNSIIVMLPTGLNKGSIQYYAVETVAALNTLAT